MTKLDNCRCSPQGRAAAARRPDPGGDEGGSEECYTQLRTPCSQADSQQGRTITTLFRLNRFDRGIVVDPKKFNLDPDPGFWSNLDPDPGPDPRLYYQL